MQPTLEAIVANLTGKSRRATLNGREYLVVPVTMIVPGVLNGSAGSLLYPHEEVSSNVQAWNGIPLTHRHPTINGAPVSARSPQIADKVWLGHIFNTTYSDKLVAEAWFDVVLTNRIDKRIIPKLEAGYTIEVSTGLFTRSEPAPEGSAFNGSPYTKIARDYKPDHLAVLMDEVGACSLRDGCGLNVNTVPSTPDSGDSVVNKEQLISWLTTNCACWKGANAGTALNAMSDAELIQLKTTAEANANTSKQLTTITNAMTTGFMINGAKVTLAADGTFKAEQITPAPQVNNKPIELTPVGQPVDNRTETFLQLLERTGSPEEKAVWNTAVEMNKAEKATLVERITANLTDSTAKAQAVAVYSGMKIEDLRKIAPAPVQVGNGAAPGATNFALGAGGPLVNQNAHVGNLEVREVGAKPLQKLTFPSPLRK